MKDKNEKFITDLMAAKSWSREKVIERCVEIVRIYCGGKYQPVETEAVDNDIIDISNTRFCGFSFLPTIKPFVEGALQFELTEADKEWVDER